MRPFEQIDILFWSSFTTFWVCCFIFKVWLVPKTSITCHPIYETSTVIIDGYFLIPDNIFKFDNFYDIFLSNLVEKNSILVSWMTPDFCTSTVKLGMDPTGIRTDLYQVNFEMGSSIITT